MLLFASALEGTGGVWITFEWLAAGLAVWVVWRGVVKANEWTKHRDSFAPGVAFVIAYVAWFSLGSANVFDMPDSLMGGVFSPIPASQWLLYVLGLAGYCAGLLVGRSKARIDTRGLQFRTHWGTGRFWVLVALTSAAMLSAFALQAAQFGIPGLSTLAGEERLGIRGIPHFVFVSCAFTLLAVIPAFLWSHSTKRLARIAGAALLLFTALAVPLLQGGRSDLVISFVTVFVIFHYLRKRTSLFTLMGIAGAGIAILSLVGYLRDYFLSYGQGMEWLEELGMPGWALPVGYVLLYVRYTVATLRDVIALVPSHTPYQHGALTFATLQTLLPGHHETSDMFFKNILGSDFVGGGQPATLLGPLCADFGAAGVFGGMLLFGVIAAMAYRAMVRKQTVLSLILYAWVLQTGFIGLFGSLFTYITTLSMPVAWFVFDRLARIHSLGVHQNYAARTLHDD